MAGTNYDTTLRIQPIIPEGHPAATSVSSAENDQAAAAAARDKINELTQPAYQGNTPVQLPNSSGAGALSLPKPISPAAEDQRRLPKLPKLASGSKLKPVLSALASFLFILMLFKAPILLSQVSYLLHSHPTSNTQIPVSASTAAAESAPPQPLITIPKINVSAPVVYPATTANAPNYDPELENGVVHYPNTPVPGQAGNSIMFGHSSNDWWQPGNYKFVFVLLDKLVPGDTLSVNYNSKRYIYQVTGSKVVEATDLSVLAPTADPTLTLITCWPAGTSLKRQIIVAKQISPAPSTSGSVVTSQPTPAPTTVLPGSAPSFLNEIKQFWQGIKDGVSNKPTTVTAPTTTPTTTLGGQ